MRPCDGHPTRVPTVTSNAIGCSLRVGLGMIGADQHIQGSASGWFSKPSEDQVEVSERDLALRMDCDNVELCIHIHCCTASQGFSTLGEVYCHDLVLKLSPHCSELSPLDCMHLTPCWPGSAGDPNHPRLFLTLQQDSPSSHLGLGPRHSLDCNPLASGMQTPSE